MFVCCLFVIVGSNSNCKLEKWCNEMLCDAVRCSAMLCVGIRWERSNQTRWDEMRCEELKGSSQQSQLSGNSVRFSVEAPLVLTVSSTPKHHQNSFGEDFGWPTSVFPNLEIMLRAWKFSQKSLKLFLHALGQAISEKMYISDGFPNVLDLYNNISLSRIKPQQYKNQQWLLSMLHYYSNWYDQKVTSLIENIPFFC